MRHAIVLQLSVYVYSGWHHLFPLVKFVLNSVLSETRETIQTQGGPQDTDGFEKIIVTLVLNIDNFIYIEILR